MLALAHRSNVSTLNIAITRSTKRSYANTTSPSVKKPTVLISGAGIGGLTCAVSLQKRGINPVVVDLAPDFSHNAGRALFLQPNALNIFRKLGLADSIEKFGKRITTSVVCNHRGEEFGSVDLESFRENLKVPSNNSMGISIDKLDLIKILAARVNVRRKTGIKSLEQKKEGDDAKVLCQLRGGVGNETFDYVIGADGIGSKVREVAFPEARVGYPGWGYYETVLEKPAEFPQDQVIEMWGPGSRLFLYPLPGNRVYVWGTFNSTMPVASQVEGLRRPDKFLTTFQPFTGYGVPALLKAVQNSKSAQVYASFPAEVRADTWHNNRIVLIGDAAHGFAPNVLQGAGLAAEDGYMLGNLIVNAYEGASKVESPSALYNEVTKLFQEQREKRVKDIQKEAFKINKTGQISDFQAIRLRLRDVVMGWNASSKTLRLRAKSQYSYDINLLD